MSPISHSDASASRRRPRQAGETATRTCAGCRQRGPRDALMRLVLSGDPPVLLPDIRRRARGRGVSVHPRSSCLQQAARRGALSKALRHEVNADVPQLARWARVQYARRAAGLLIGAYRARRAVLGAAAAHEALQRREVALLVVAADAALSREQLLRSAQRLGKSCLVYGDKESLGKLFGRRELAVIAVLDAAIGRELTRAAQSESGLAEAS